MKGFTLLFSIVTMSILLTIAGAIVQISSKQLRISNLSRDSQIAFYAADSGLECARFWDKKGIFDNTENDNNFNFKCGDQNITNVVENENVLCPQQIDENESFCKSFSFSFSIGSEESPSSVNVIVYKNTSATIVGQTTIQSRGYNTNDSSRSRRLERALELSYI